MKSASSYRVFHTTLERYLLVQCFSQPTKAGSDPSAAGRGFGELQLESRLRVLVLLHALHVIAQGFATRRLPGTEQEYWSVPNENRLVSGSGTSPATVDGVFAASARAFARVDLLPALDAVLSSHLASTSEQPLE